MRRKKLKEEEIVVKKISTSDKLGRIYQGTKNISVKTNRIEKCQSPDNVLSNKIMWLHKVKVVEIKGGGKAAVGQLIDLNYNFNQESDPTDEQWAYIMYEVAVEAREKREKADHAYQQLINEEVNAAAERMDALIKERTNGKS